VNVKTKSIEWMEIARERTKKVMRMINYEKQLYSLIFFYIYFLVIF